MNKTSKTEVCCLNCGSATAGPYCSLCGQSSTVSRITFRETLEQFLSASFSLQGPLLKTVSSLFSNPGEVFRGYLSGKRKKFYQPISFFILLTAVYLMLRFLINYDPFVGQEGIQDQRIGAEINSRINMAAKFMYGHINYFMFIIALSTGLMLKLFFYKRYNLAEYTAVGFFISGMYIIISIVFMLLSKIFDLHGSQLQPLLLLALIFFCSYSLFLQTSLLAILKYFLVSLFSIFLYMLTGFGLSLIIVTIT